MAAPTVVGVGTFAAGSAAITPGLPSGLEPGDWMYLNLSTANQAITIPGGGWDEVTGSPLSTGSANTAGGLRQTLFRRVYEAGDSAPTTSDSGSYQAGQIIAFRGVDSENAISTSIFTATGSGDASWPAITTTVDDCRIVGFFAGDRDIATSGTQLADVEVPSFDGATYTDYYGAFTNAGQGGGIACASGTKADPGTINDSLYRLSGNNWVNTVFVIALAPAGAGSVDGNASGPLGSVTLSAAGGSSTGSAGVAGAFQSVSVTAMSGSAAVGAEAAGSLSGVIVSAAAGQASGSAGAVGTLSSVTVTPCAASVTGEASASGSLPTEVVTALSGSAAGDAAASGALATVSLTPLTGSSLGEAAVSGALSAVTVMPATGAATGGTVADGNATGFLSSVALTAPSGAAQGESPNGNASGVLSSITISQATGSAVGNGSATGVLSDVTATAQSGAATGHASVITPLPLSIVTSPSGGASGAASAYISFGTITVTFPGGTAHVGANITGDLSAARTVANDRPGRAAIGYRRDRATATAVNDRTVASVRSIR